MTSSEKRQLMTEPIITESPGSIKIDWCEADEMVFSASIERLSENSRGISGEFNFSHLFDEFPPIKHLYLNLRSTQARQGIVRRLEALSLPVDFNPLSLVDQVCDLAIDSLRRETPPEEIWPSEDDTLEVEYLLKPLLYLNHPAVIFGDYGSLKSLVALAIAYTVQLPYHDNTLGLLTAKEPCPCLYLDYEDDPSSFRRRWSALDRGFDKGATPILYRRMTGTLSDSVEPIQRIVENKKIGLILVDSLGPAARGNLNDPEPAIKYHGALRQLGVTSLTLAHTAKDQFTKRRTIFGSVFFTNLARAVWECKAEQETGEDEAIISLKHTKANLSRKHPPLGYKFTFTNNSITVVKADLKDTGLSGELPLSLRIKDLLRGGAMPLEDIAEALNSKADTTGRTLRRMRTKDQVVKLEDNTWGLSLL